MLFCALATDYDGTLARSGQVDEATIGALRELKSAGKRLVLITGRELEQLRLVFEYSNDFDVIVAENGALLYLPATREMRKLAPAPPEKFIAALRARNVEPLSVGHSIVATWTPNEAVMIETLRELGLDWQLIFNKGAVMCLPPGVNKASGLKAALEQLGLSAFNAVGVGDAENDRAFLDICGCSVAVANALPAVKEAVDIVTRADHGAGVSELIRSWLDDPCATFAGVRRHDLLLGTVTQDGAQVALPADRGAILIAGSSGVGKTTLTHLLVERLIERGYQVCIVDPEGDYDRFEGIAHLGSPERTPAPEEVADLIAAPRTSVAINLLAVDTTDRPAYFAALLAPLESLRARCGRPHWLVLDEAHHLSPALEDVRHRPMPSDMSSTLFVTTHPKNLSRAALERVHTVIAVGEAAGAILAEFCAALGMAAPQTVPGPPSDAVLLWDRDRDAGVLTVKVGKSRQVHQRHIRKYAEGRLGSDKSFHFRGSEGKLNLRAHNLATFLDLARGVDDATWLHHLKRGDYTRWFEKAIKDEELAAEVRPLESESDPHASRERLIEAVTRRYAATGTD
ncbi:MAG TPA: HAD-IIB family hydrolase [Steroidobacteraceae bacterium]|nr:HAD-IIB family hydrolase [Steroidobacteraceae bacterium]